MYVFQEFPKVKYHRTLPPVTIADPGAEEALGPDWADTPAAFLEPVVVAEVHFGETTQIEEIKRPRRRK